MSSSGTASVDNTQQASVSELASLAQLNVSAEEMHSLKRQGFVAAERRGVQGTPYFKLRFRHEGRQIVRGIGTDRERAASVIRELEALQHARRHELEFERVVRAVMAVSRTARARIEPLIAPLGFRYHGFSIRRRRGASIVFDDAVQNRSPRSIHKEQSIGVTESDNDDRRIDFVKFDAARAGGDDGSISDKAPPPSRAADAITQSAEYLGRKPRCSKCRPIVDRARLMAELESKSPALGGSSEEFERIVRTAQTYLRITRQVRSLAELDAVLAERAAGDRPVQSS